MPPNLIVANAENTPQESAAGIKQVLADHGIESDAYSFIPQRLRQACQHGQLAQRVDPLQSPLPHLTQTSRDLESGHAVWR